VVADTWNHRLQRFDGEGKVVAVVEAGFFGPRGLAVDPQTGDLLVADTGNHRLVRLSSAGAVLATIGKQGSAVGEFWEPTGVAVAADRRIAVADSANGRVQIFDPGGVWLAGWSIPGWRREVYSEPSLAFSASGELWLTVPLDGEVLAFDRGGRRVAQLILPRVAETEPARPMALAFAPGGARLVVTMLDGRLVELPVALGRSESTAIEVTGAP
ncbi:MAG: NHL repeat-containing protein, partial [Thermoanaerobaculia bacterium]